MHGSQLQHEPLHVAMKLVGIRGLGGINQEYTSIEGMDLAAGGQVLKRAGRPVRLTFHSARGPNLQ